MKMLEDLENVVRLQRESGFTANFNEDWASTQFLRTHHATISDMAARLEAAERDAARYRWLRDVSRPEHGMFYLSVWAGLHQVKWTPEKVDETIDDAMSRAEAMQETGR